MVDITTTDEMNREIQNVTEKWFDLSMSAPITMSSLRTRLGFLSDTDFANILLAGDVHIPWDVDDVTATVLDKISTFLAYSGRVMAQLMSRPTTSGTTGDDSRNVLRPQSPVYTLATIIWQLTPTR